MATILKPGIERIMRVFYQHKAESIHLRELARKTHMYGQSITRYLKFLEKNKYILSKKEGNLRKYHPQNNQLVYSIWALFDIEKFKKLPSIKKQAIVTYLKTLPQQPVYAVLFGSTAKENYTEQSDVDIMLITNERVDAKNAEKEVDALHAIKVSTFQMRYKDFMKELKLKEDKIIQSALNTGYPLINHIQYYGVLNNEKR